MRQRSRLIALIVIFIASLMSKYIATIVLLINAWTLLRFRQDKVRAINGERRIAEADLLGLALIGGTPAAFLARHLFHHKTKKEPFSTHLKVIAVVQLCAVVAYFLVPEKTKIRLERQAWGLVKGLSQ